MRIQSKVIISKLKKEIWKIKIKVTNTKDIQAFHIKINSSNLVNL